MGCRVGWANSTYVFFSVKKSDAERAASKDARGNLDPTASVPFKAKDVQQYLNEFFGQSLELADHRFSAEELKQFQSAKPAGVATAAPAVAKPAAAFGSFGAGKPAFGAAQAAAPAAAEGAIKGWWDSNPGSRGQGWQINIEDQEDLEVLLRKDRKPLGVREHQWDKVLKDAKERRRKNPHGAIVPKVVFGYAAPLGLVVCAQKWHSEEKQQIAALESLEKQMKNVEVEQAKLNEKLRTRTKEHGRLVKHVMKAMQAYARHLQVQRVDQHDLDSRLSNVNKTYNDFKPKLDSVIARFDMQDTPEASSALYTEPVQNSHRLNELLSLSRVMSAFLAPSLPLSPHTPHTPHDTPVY